MNTKFNGILTLLLALTVQFVFAQKTVSGVVTDGNAPIPGVSVLIEGTTTGTETDFDGKYQIAAKSGDILVFSYIGMKTMKMTVGNSNTININLQEDENVLDEIIVVAYGTAKKSDYTGSASQISAKELEVRPLTNITNAIEGSTAGVQVSMAGGQPGSSQEIRIRGIGSVSASNDPLYIVDGFPFNGSFNSINPNDIESLTILKDASATSLYGNKAANGVVVITTKKGKKGEGQFNLSISNSFIDRSIKEYDRVDARDYYELMWEARRNSLAVPGTATEAQVTAANATASSSIYSLLLGNPFNVANTAIVGTDGKINQSAVLKVDDTDWTSPLERIGMRKNIDMNYSAATDKSDYYVSVGYLDESGYLLKSDFTRFTGRANVNFQVKEWFKTGFNIGASTSKGNQSQATSDQTSSFVNPVRFSRSMAPIYSIYMHNADGCYLLDANGEKQYDLYAARPQGGNNGRHIFAEIDWNEDLDKINALNSKAYVDFRLLTGLNLTLNASLEQRDYVNSEYRNKLIGDGAPLGAASRFNTKRSTLGLNQLLNYTKSFDKHNLSALLGHESYKFLYNETYQYKTQQIADGNYELINFVNTTENYTIEDRETGESYFSRLSYDYDNKYYISGSYRTDGTSKFSEDKRWGDFWSVGLAYRLEKESFLKDVKFLDLLKLRASYGELGNNLGINYYAYQGLYDIGVNNQTEPGILLNSLSSPNLFWETSVNKDVALEFGLFNRINGTIEYYHRISDNLLFNVPLPLSSGVETRIENIGAMFNSGIELGLNFDVIKKENLEWNLGFNASTVKNEFTELSQPEIITGTKKLMVGRSIYDYWLREWYGVDPATGAALYIPTEAAVTANGTDIVTINDEKFTKNQANAKYNYVGTAIPDLIGSISNSLRYKNLSLGFLLTYQMGGKIYDGNYASIMHSGTYGTALHVDVLDRWQQPGDITNVPRMDAGQIANFGAGSSRWLLDASYLNVKNISLSYNLPSSFTDVTFLNSAQVYFSAENVFSFNAKQGLNIQQEFNGTVSNVYTASRLFTMGINVKF